MNGDEDVGFVFVGNVGTFMQRDEHVGLAGVDDFYVGAVLLHIAAKGQRHIQVDVLLLGPIGTGTSVLSAMSGINDKGELMLFGSIGNGDAEKQENEKTSNSSSHVLGHFVK